MVVVSTTETEYEEVRAMLSEASETIKSQTATIETMRDTLANQDERIKELIVALEESNKALVDFKARVREVGIRYAEENNWCSTFDDALSELGLERRFGNFEVKFNVTMWVSQTMLARDADHAEDLARHALRIRDNGIPYRLVVANTGREMPCEYFVGDIVCEDVYREDG